MTDTRVPIGGRPDNTSSSWLDRVRSGDPQAWRTFVQVYGPLVYHWCQRCGLQRADAANVGQEVFKSVFLALPRFRREGNGSFRGWLRTITRNKVRDCARERTRTFAGGGDENLMATIAAAPDPDDAPDPDEERILYRQALNLVLAGHSEESRQAFLRVVIDRQNPAAVAADLGMTVNAVYLVKSRVLRRLREEFADLLDPDAGTPPPADPEAP